MLLFAGDAAVPHVAGHHAVQSPPGGEGCRTRCGAQQDARRLEMRQGKISRDIYCVF